MTGEIVQQPPRRAHPRGEWIRGVVALAICLLLVGLIGLKVPDTAESFPQHHDARPGEWADNTRYAARVVGTDLARRVEPAPDSYDRLVEAPPGAVAVVVEIEHRVHEEAMSVTSLATLESRDGHSAKALASSRLPDTGPGFVGAGPLIFVVSADSVPGARLVLPSRRQLFTGLVVDTIRVDLELTDTTPIRESVQRAPETRRVAR